ncbi:MAG TPA: hypothetical protein VGY56_10730 [Verrucomicrobiae bacterium]|nr:hypothetical protein [Verrucomicrobiae bacterium]
MHFERKLLWIVALATFAVLMATAARAQFPLGPVNTNAEVGPLVDTNGYFGWPIDPIADSFSVTNYTGGDDSLSLGFRPTMPAGAVFFYTNFTLHTSTTVFSNGTMQCYMTEGTVWKLGTNGTVSVLETNGVASILANGNFTISSNGLPWGTISCSNFNGFVPAANVGSLTGTYATISQLFFATNLIIPNMVFEGSLAQIGSLSYDTNWLYTNLTDRIEGTLGSNLVSATSLLSSNLITDTNSVWTNAMAMFETVSNTAVNNLLFDLANAQFADSNYTYLTSNLICATVLGPLITGTSNNLWAVSNLFLTSGLLVVSNYLNDVSNEVTAYTFNLTNYANAVGAAADGYVLGVSNNFYAATNALWPFLPGLTNSGSYLAQSVAGLAGQLSGIESSAAAATNDFYSGPNIDFIQSYTASIASLSSSPATVSLHNAWPSGSYSVWITPSDANTASFLITNAAGNFPSACGYYINSQNGTGFQINFYRQTPFQLNFMVLCQYNHQ